MKLSPVDLNLLMALDAVLRTRSIGKAAAAVGLSKTAMSHAMARLRAQMNDPILVRAGQTWHLSERAQELAPRVHELVVEALSALAPRRAGGDKEVAREFRIHATDHVLSILGMALGHAVTRDAPRVVLRFLPLVEDEAAALRDSIDLALGVLDDLPDELRRQRLFTDDYACVVRKGHPSVRGKISLAQYLALNHVLVAPRGRPGGVVDAALEKRGLSRRCVRMLPYFLNALDFVADSDCIVTISAHLARQHARRFDLQVLSPPIPLPTKAVSQVWHARVNADPSHVWLRRLVASAASEMTKRTRASVAPLSE